MGIALNSVLMAVDTSSGRIVLGRAHEFSGLPPTWSLDQRMDRERLLSALIAARPGALRNYIAQWNLVFDARRPTDNEVVELVRAALTSGYLRIGLVVPKHETPQVAKGSSSLSLPLGIGGVVRTPVGGVGVKGEITGLGATAKDGRVRAQPFMAISGSADFAGTSLELSAHTETGFTAYAGYAAGKMAVYSSDSSDAVIYNVGLDACLGLCIGFSLERKLTATEIEDSYTATLIWRYSRTETRSRKPRPVEQCTPDNPTGQGSEPDQPVQLHLK